MQRNTITGLSDTAVLTWKHTAYSILLLSLPSICFIPQDNPGVPPSGDAPAWVGWAGLRVNLGTAEPATGSGTWQVCLVCNFCSIIPASQGLQDQPGQAEFFRTCAVPVSTPERDLFTHRQCGPGLLQGRSPLNPHLHKGKCPGFNRNAFL